MGKFIFLGLIATVLACAPSKEKELTTYRDPIYIGNEFVFTRSYTECGGFEVDTVKIVDTHPRCVKIMNKKGVEHWTNTNYFRRYVYPIK